MTIRLVVALTLASIAPLAAQTTQGAAATYQCTQPTGGDPNRPHPVCDIKPTITHGPYLSAPTDTSATITWMTNLPSHSKVIYGSAGQLNREVVPTTHGMAPVGTLDAVRLTGLRPGETYSYRVVSTPVLELTSYWPKKGLEAQSGTYSFTTLSTRSRRRAARTETATRFSSSGRVSSRKWR